MLYEGRTFEGETITLDGNEFLRCTFDQCIIEYSGGATDIQDCRFPRAKLNLHGAAKAGAMVLETFIVDNADRGIIEIGGRKFTLVDD